MKLFFIILMMLFMSQLSAQEGQFFTWDIDSIFDEPEQESQDEEVSFDTAMITTTIRNLITRQGIGLDTSFSFLTGVAPGWWGTPWFPPEEDEHGYYLHRYFRFYGAVALNAQISEVLRVRATVGFEIPFWGFGIGDFFFDYNFYDRVFLRAGRYGLGWGISPNFGFTNLLARVPRDGYSGDSYILKADIPLGIGGFQLLTLTRVNLFFQAPLPRMMDFGFGAKYNWAMAGYNLDLAVFYQEGMAMRGSLSVQTSIWNTDIYSEGLIAIDPDEPSNISGAANIGFGRSFFQGRLSVNGELFYNAEQDTYFYHPETEIREAGKSPFIEGFNIALNMSAKIMDLFDTHFFANVRYAPEQNSLLVIPGISLSPFSHIGMSVAVPIVLGNRDGYYYRYTALVDDVGKPLPFAIIFGLSVSGSSHVARYY